MSKRVLDLFGKVLPRLDRHDHSLYGSLTEEERKEFHPVVVMRFLSQAPQPYGDWYLMSANHYANQHLHDIYEHPELQAKLLAACGVGERVNHNWIPNAKRANDDDLVEYISRFYPRANRMEIDVILGKFTEETFGHFVDGTSLDPAEAKKLKKSFKAHRGA